MARRRNESQALQPAFAEFAETTAHAGPVGVLRLNLKHLDLLLSDFEAADSKSELRSRVERLRRAMHSPSEAFNGLLSQTSAEDSVSIRSDVLESQLEQIREALTLERARYYLRRLRKGLTTVKTGKINDINLARWQEYDNIQTDSLWLIERRDRAGAHLGSYWGNFVPQIPHQLMLRYTKRSDWVLDGFSGSGTTLIECRRLGRNGIGIELSATVAAESRELIEQEPNLDDVTTRVIEGDSRTVDLGAIAHRHGIDAFQLVLLHPPYHDIIKFSDDPRDLSNAPSIEHFIEMFGAVVDNAGRLLERGRFLAVVIGDKYSKGEWIPLGFRCMEEVAKRGYLLKSIVVKNFDETKGKRSQEELWRYRALVGGFYVFKHEYILIFQKP